METDNPGNDPNSGHRPLLSVVFSFKNEEDSLDELIRRCRATFQAERDRGVIRGHELVFVNDASTDRSLEILAREAREGDIRVVTMSRPFGITPCVLAGMEYAEGDLVVYMDADLQDPPELISEMLAEWQKGGEDVDVVHTVRLSRAGETSIKLAITRLGYFILKTVMDVDLIPNAGDFKLLSRRVVRRLVEFKEKKPFMRGLVHWVGFKQARVYYHRQARFGGETKFPVLGAKVIRNFFESALISFSEVPLYFISLTGLFISAGSFLYLIFVVIEKFRGHNLPGWSAIMVAILFLGGVQLIALGIIGLYVSTIYQETKQRPNYIVQSTLGFPDNPHAGDGHRLGRA